MTVTEQLGSLGSWSLTLVDDTPRSITDQLGFFGHIGIWRGRVDVEQSDDATLLATARYVGVLREKPTGPRSLEGAGMIYWLGDEDGKGAVLESPVVFNAATLTECVTRLLPPAVTVGTIHDPGGTYTGTHQWQTPRAVLDTICAAFGVEYRVNNNGTIDVGTQAQLYGSTTSTIISARNIGGQDFDLTSLGGTFTTDTSVIDYSDRVVLLGQKTDNAGNSTSFVEASASATTSPYKDLHGNTVHVTRTVSDAGQTDASAPAAAQLQLNEFNRAKRALSIRAEDYDTTGTAVVGQNAYVFDPENGLVDTTQQLDFRGELIFPQLIRISALQWSVTAGHTVAFRTQDGVWVDLTRYVSWDPGSDEITVGDLPRTLTTSSNPVLTQTQAAPDSSVPDAPTGLALSTTSVESAKGQSTATVTASWTAPAQNTDGSVIQDLSYYLVQYRWHGRAPLWDTRIAPTTTIDIPGLAVGLVYDVQVAAVDTTGHVSAYTPVAQITAAPDQTAPNAPSDPTVSSYLGQLRISWDGKDNTGAAMPPDFALVEVHVSATSGFTPDSSPGSATLVSELSTAGVAYATAPYGATRYVKLVAVDNSQNRSAPSNQVSGSTVQVADGDIQALSVGKLTAGTMSADVVIGGRFATALTGARVELNSLGLQKFDTDGVTKLISLTGTEELLTGTYKTAASGRRIEMGSGGTTGEIDFYAPDGTKSVLLAYTESTGLEAMQFGIPIPGVPVSTSSPLWNKINLNNDHSGWSSYRANKHEFVFGGANNASGADSSTPGYFSVYETSDYGATGTVRLQIAPGSFGYWDSLGHERLTIDTTRIGFWDGNTTPRMFLWQNQNVDFELYDSTVLREHHEGDRFDYHFGNVPSGQLAGFYGLAFQGGYGSGVLRLACSNGQAANFKIWNDANGTWFECKDWTDTNWLGVRAAAFTVISDAGAKQEIGDYEGSALDVIRAAKVRTYRRRDVQGPRLRMEETEIDGGRISKRTVPGGDHTPVPGPVEIGLVAQEAPEQIVRAAREDGSDPMIDLYQLAVLTLKATQELDQRLAQMEGR